jgi:hypothetical protein
MALAMVALASVMQACSGSSSTSIIASDAATSPESGMAIIVMDAAVDGGPTSNPWANPPNTPKQVGASKALTCEWLDGDNCWKSALRELERACVPGGIGSVNPSNPSEILYPSGMKALRTDTVKMDYGYYTPNYRYFRADGTFCGAVRVIFGLPSTVSIEVGGRVVLGDLFGSDVSRLVCPDGSTYATSPEDTSQSQCVDYTSLKYQGKTPLVLGECVQGTCSPLFGGSTNGRLAFAPFKP